MYRKYASGNPISDQFALFIESLNEDDFNLMINNIPDEILKREPYEFIEFDEISADDLKNCIND